MVGEQKRRRCKTRHRQRLRAAVLFCVLAAHAHGGQDGGARRAPPAALPQNILQLRGGVSKYYNVTAPPKRGGVFIEPESGVVQVIRRLPLPCAPAPARRAPPLRGQARAGKQRVCAARVRPWQRPARARMLMPRAWHSRRETGNPSGTKAGTCSRSETTRNGVANAYAR